MNRTTLRAAVTGALLGALTVGGMVGSAYSQSTPEVQAMHRAAIVVDTGSGVTSRCVSFAEDSISGIEALNRAGLSPAVRAYSGQGGAVCASTAWAARPTANCLTCAAPNYWAYHRAESGSGGFAYSSQGAGSVQVTDGDVEGWRWGTGSAPAFRSFNLVCPVTPPPTTTTTTTTPASGPDGNGSDNGGPSGGPSSPGDGPASGEAPPGDGPAGESPTSTTGTGPTTTTTASGPDEGGQGADDESDATDEALDGEEAAARGPLEEDDGGGGARTWLAFVVILGGFGLAGWRIHRIRNRSS